MPKNTYETEELLHQYLLFHYASELDQFPYKLGAVDALNFPKRCAEVSNIKDLSLNRALDLGCSVGRSTFELARYCTEVIGIDYSHSFINAAKILQLEGSHTVTRREEGLVYNSLKIQVDARIDRDRVSFEQGDAQFIREDIGQFDLVLACNLICRLPEPKRLFDRLPGLIKPDGHLFLTTPFTWMKMHTPIKNWLLQGEKNSFDVLRNTLKPNFILEADWDMPFLIREHARKFQYCVAKASRWRRI